VQLRNRPFILIFLVILTVLTAEVLASPGRPIGRLLGSWLNGHTTRDHFVTGWMRRLEGPNADVRNFSRTDYNLNEVDGTIIRYTPGAGQSSPNDFLRVQTRYQQVESDNIVFADIHLGITQREFQQGRVEIDLPGPALSESPMPRDRAMQDAIELTFHEGEDVSRYVGYRVREIDGTSYRQTVIEDRYFRTSSTQEKMTTDLSNPDQLVLRRQALTEDDEVLLGPMNQMENTLTPPPGYTILHASLEGEGGRQLTLIMRGPDGALVAQSRPVNSPAFPRQEGGPTFEIGPAPTRNPERALNPVQREAMIAETRIYQAGSRDLVQTTDPGVAPANTVGGGMRLGTGTSTGVGSQAR
jgi:hypothetical protein